jgi:hypothetical protein
MSDIVKFKGGSLPANALANLKTAVLRAKDAISVPGSKPFLRLEKGTGIWVYGPRSTEVEENSLWAINPTTFEIGWVAWRGGKPVGKKMRPILQPNILASELPDVGAEWQENVQFDLQCVYGEDVDTVVTYTSNSGGGREAFSDTMTAFLKQAETDPERIVPVVEMKSEWYMHAEYGRIYKPVFEVKKWMSFGGGEQAPAEPQPASPSPATNGAAEPAKAAAAPSRRRAAAAVTDVEVQDDTPPPGAAAEPVQRRRRRAAAA